MDRLKIRVFKAVDEPDTCALYLKEHAKVLEDFGVDHVVAKEPRWLLDPLCHVIIAEHDDLGMVGGIRVDIAHLGSFSPMEEAIHKMDPKISTVMDKLKVDGTAEVCGLWNANRFAGRGVPLLLSVAAVSIANQLRLTTMTCFVAHYTLRHALKVGFTILEDVGDGGTFTYPVADIRSIAMIIPDVVSLETARPEYREKLLSLRLRPEQTRVEAPSGIELTVAYELMVDRKIIDIRAYQNIQQERHLHSLSASVS